MPPHDDKHARGHLSDPSRLRIKSPDDDGLFQVVIETPKGSRNKYAFDPDQGAFVLKHVLPAGMTFPYEFGFVPSTLADDGDPIDVLVLMDQPAFPGCVTHCRLIGAIKGEQVEKKKRTRNDRLVAVESESHDLAHVRRLSDLGGKFVNELEMFFVHYHELNGKKYRLLGTVGPDAARKLVKAAAKKV